MSTTTHSATVTLPTDTTILITREFAAPARLVWRALTEPELVRRWWGAERGEIALVEIDLRVGGGWRHVMTSSGGDEVGFHGEYRELVPPERIVSTEVYEGMPDASSTNTVTLVEREGRTTMSVLVEHASREHRDGHIASGMEGGMQDSYDALERVAVDLGA